MNSKKFIDITGDQCPITLVKVLMALDSLVEGDILEVHIAEGGAAKNVPRSLSGGGHKVHNMLKQNDGSYILYVEKCGGLLNAE